MIVCHNLTKRFNGVAAVSQLNLHVKSGELYGFLGPNGAGKTTTIRMLTGLLQPDEGQVHLGGIDMVQEPLKAKALISFVPDFPHVYEKLTGREFLTFVCDLRNLSRQQTAPVMDELLERFEIARRADDLIGNYSHGMKQKISLIGALLPDPEILFLDEATVGLDPKSARALKDLLRERCARGKTVLMSTHILEIAQQMSDRVGIIQNGKLVAEGNMEQLRQTSHRREAADGASLEDLFLELTGGADYAELTESLES